MTPLTPRDLVRRFVGAYAVASVLLALGVFVENMPPGSVLVFVAFGVGLWWAVQPVRQKTAAPMAMGAALSAVVGVAAVGALGQAALAVFIAVRAGDASLWRSLIFVWATGVLVQAGAAAWALPRFAAERPGAPASHGG